MNKLGRGIPGGLKKPSFLEPHVLLYRVEEGGPTLGAIVSFRLWDNLPQAVEIDEITDTFSCGKRCPVLGRQDRGINRKLFGNSASGV